MYMRYRGNAIGHQDPVHFHSSQLSPNLDDIEEEDKSDLALEIVEEEGEDSEEGDSDLCRDEDDDEEVSSDSEDEISLPGHLNEDSEDDDESETSSIYSVSLDM